MHWSFTMIKTTCCNSALKTNTIYVSKDTYILYLSRCANSLKAAPLLQVRGRLCGDQADQLLHAVVLGEKKEQPTVLGLALLQNVILLHQLSQRHVLPVQQLVNVGGGVQVKLPKHGGRCDGGHSPGWLHSRVNLALLQALFSSDIGITSTQYLC